MTENDEGWTTSIPGRSTSPTVQQPKKNSRQLFRKTRTEVKTKNDSSWCQNVVFCGRRRQKRILSQFVDIELAKCSELYSPEFNKVSYFPKPLIWSSPAREGRRESLPLTRFGNLNNYFRITLNLFLPESHKIIQY